MQFNLTSRHTDTVFLLVPVSTSTLGTQFSARCKSSNLLLAF